MNPMLKHFFFSSLVNQIGNEVKKTVPNNNFGKLKSISFLVGQTKTVQKVKFENYEGSNDLTEEEKNKFSKMVSIDIKKEQQGTKSIFCILDCDKKTITIQYNYLDGREPKILNL